MVKFIKNPMNNKNELVIDEVVTHSIENIVMLDTEMSKKYRRFEKKLNKKIGKNIEMVDTVSGEIIKGYYFGLCEDFDGKGISYFFANPLKKGKFSTIPYGIVNEFKYTVI